MHYSNKVLAGGEASVFAISSCQLLYYACHNPTEDYLGNQDKLLLIHTHHGEVMKLNIS